MTTSADTPETKVSRFQILRLISRDWLALAAVIFLLLVVACAVFGPWLMGDLIDKPNFRAGTWRRSACPRVGLTCSGRHARPQPARAARGGCAGHDRHRVLCGVLSVVIGGMLGLIAGYSRGAAGTMIMRGADIVMSFPSLLLALIVLFSLGPSVTNLILVLAITRVPIYLRTTRAEVLEVRERMFVSAAVALGANHTRILFRHIAPIVLPTLVTIGAIDFATVVLAESSLSFLGLGIQAPEFTWGAMVATGRGYLSTAWWIAFWPGLAILLTTLSLNILSSWWRTYADPQQRWRIELARSKKGIPEKRK